MKKLILTVLLCTAVFMGVFGANTVKVWFAGTQKQLMDLVDSKLIPEFEKNNPDIKIKAEFIPWGELSTKLTTSFAGGIGPDIFMHGQAAIAGFADKGIIMPIDSILSKIEDPQDFGATLNAGLFKGKKYYIPVFGSGRLLAYRKDFFVQAGLDPQDAPMTWEQLISYSKKLTSVENNRYKCAGFDLPVSGVDLQQVWSGFLYQNGGDLFDNEMNPVFNSTQGVQALQFYVDLIRKEKVAPDYGTSKQAIYIHWQAVQPQWACWYLKKLTILKLMLHRHLNRLSFHCPRQDLTGQAFILLQALWYQAKPKIFKALPRF